jgi:hypothetical protein
MEPSLRSSNPRTQECKLRRCQEALHETTKRFVERFSQDIRISQYADVAFATKKMENHAWYWLEPLGRTGFLVCLPHQPIVWIDEQLKMSFKIPIRVRSAIFEKKSVFVASLNQTEGILRVEDCWMHCGTFLRDQAFTKRWGFVQQFFGREYKFDSFVQQGLALEPAVFQPLTNAKNWKPMPTLMFAQGDVYPRRLRVQFGPVKTKPQQQVQKPVALFVNDEEEDEEERSQSEAPASIVSEEEGEDKTQPLVAKAVPHEDHPDTYTLWVNGKKKGFGAVQDLDLSRVLREAVKANRDLRVEILWNEEFRMYEISSLLSTE